MRFVQVSASSFFFEYGPLLGRNRRALEGSEWDLVETNGPSKPSQIPGRQPLQVVVK